MSNRKKIIGMIPNPDKILVKISRKQAEDITSKTITRDDGVKVKLFLEPEFDTGFDRRYQQNVSVGTIVAVGDNIDYINKSDIAIIDYLVRNNDDVLVGYINGDQLVCLDPKTTYHTEDAIPTSSMRKDYVEGDFKNISPILGVIRRDNIIAFDPYIFLVHKSNMIVSVLPNGKILETKEDISEREILAAHDKSIYKAGDTVLIKEIDLFSRHINGKEISVVFDQDIMLKKYNST